MNATLNFFMSFCLNIWNTVLGIQTQARASLPWHWGLKSSFFMRGPSTSIACAPWLDMATAVYLPAQGPCRTCLQWDDDSDSAPEGHCSAMYCCPTSISFSTFFSFHSACCCCVSGKSKCGDDKVTRCDSDKSALAMLGRSHCDTCQSLVPASG